MSSPKEIVVLLQKAAVGCGFDELELGVSTSGMEVAGVRLRATMGKFYVTRYITEVELNLSSFDVVNETCELMRRELRRFVEDASRGKRLLRGGASGRT